MTMVSQAEFARMKGVSKQAVTDWKKEGRLKIVDGKIDVEATEAVIIPGSGYRTKRRAPARQPDTAAGRQVDVLARQADAPASQVDGAAPFVSGSGPAPSPPLGPWTAPITILARSGIPIEASVWDVSICTGASDLAVILLRKGQQLPEVRDIVDTWVALQRHDACEVLDEELDPPFGCASWSEHCSFTDAWIDGAGSSWDELIAEAAGG